MNTGESRRLTPADFGNMLRRLADDFRVLTLARANGHLTLERHVGSSSEVIVGGVRSVEPLKGFLFRARERVAEGFDPLLPSDGAKPFCLVGVKACDLRSLDVLDFVFLGSDGVVDPFYERARRESFLITSDCSEPADTCFCAAMEGRPYCTSGFDLNLSRLSTGFLVEPGSPKGREFVEQNRDFFSAVGEGDLKERDQRRAEAFEQVEVNLRLHEVPDSIQLEGAVEKAFEAPLWQEEATECVECGACNTICPTCHCFLLYDQASGSEMVRLRTWDACLLKDFARVAGGGNPRPEIWGRLRNRFVKKFDFFPKVSGTYACTGCGRCIEACPARIDIRRVLRKVVSHETSGQSVQAH